ncbi:MAG: PDZ domain-containing protein, partial [Acidobacteriota bacterium]
MRHTFAATLFALLTLALASSLSAQVASEDLELEEPSIPREVEELFTEAELLFQTVDQSNSIELFSAVIEALDPLRFEGDEQVLERLEASLVYRARANFNLGESTETELDLERLLRLDPNYDIDRTVVSSKLSQLFDETRSRIVGFAELLVTPSDAEVTVDGNLLETESGAIAMQAGSYVAEIVRPGYTPTTLAFDVQAGDTVTLETELVRSSAVISLRTSPAGAEVLIDSVLRAQSDGPAEPTFIPPPGKTRSDFSAMSLLADIEPGPHIIEVRYPGFRSYRASLEVTEARDFVLRPVVLDPQAGTVVLNGLGSGAVTSIDGREVRPRGNGSGQHELILSPGSYRLSVTKGSLGVFEAPIDVEDRQTVELQVELKPALVLVGILGGDDVGAQRLEESLVAAFDRSGYWSLLDRTEGGATTLSGAGLETEALRALAERGSPTSGSVNWQQVQQQSDTNFPGSVYLLAVLGDDLIAQQASLWAWPAAPGPSRPDLLSLPLDDSGAIDQLVGSFRPSLDERHAHLGLLAIDSAAGAGPVVAQLTAGAAGAAAGLQVGDEITAVDGAPVFNVAQFDAAVLRAVGGSMTVEASRSGQTLSFDVTPQQSYTVVDVNDPNLIRAAAAAELNNELARESERSPRWLLQLNHAAILLRSGDLEAAVRELRRIETPTSQGLGRATVDYWIGLALLRLSVQQASYIEPAKAAFQKAAEAAEGRLFH